MIEQLRDESEKSAKEIEVIVEDGKKRYRDAVTKYKAIG